MVSPVLHVLGTYRRRRFGWFLVFGVLWSASFRWLMFPGGLQSYLTFSIVLTCGFALLLGRHLMRAFAPCRARLVPGFARSQFTAAALASLPVVAVMITFADAIPMRSASLVGIGVILFSYAIAAFALGWFAHPALWVLASPILFYVAARRGGVAAGIDLFLSGTTNAILLMVLLNGVALILLARRMLGTHEEAWERSMPPVTLFPKWENRVQFDENRWSARWGLGRMDAAFRKLPSPAQDRRSRRRLLELGLALPAHPSVALISAIAIVGVWVASMALPFGRTAADIGSRTILLYPVFFLFTFLMTNWKRNLQSTLLLPARRRELIFDVGALLLRQMLRYWAALGMSLWILEWMPKPFEMRSMPSPAFLIAGFAVQLPLFALASLVVLNPHGWRASLAVVAGFGVWISFVILAELNRLPLLTILALVAGVALITYSYRRWLNFEVD